MTIDKYISRLRDKNIFIYIENERIGVDAPDEAITPELIEELTVKKQEILDFFRFVKKTKQSITIPKAEDKESYPLSSAQRRMYFLYEFDKTGISYNMPGFYRFSKALNVLKLEETFKRLIERHQSLRTIFEIVNGIPMQRVLDSSSFKLESYQCEVSEVDDQIERFVRSFDLSNELPIRVKLLDTNDDHYIMLIDIHHISSDGVSQEILMRDFWNLYHDEVLPELQIQYIDYAVWQQSEEYQELMSNHEQYWLDMYSEVPTRLELPINKADTIEVSKEANVELLQLTSYQSLKLRELAQAEGVTLYTVFLAIYNVLLSKLTNQDDIVVGTPTAGRHHSDLEGLVGMFVNTLALRNHVDAQKTFQEFLSSVHDTTIGAFDHQLFQYEDLVEALGLSTNFGQHQLFNVFFSYTQENKGAGLSDSNLKMERYEKDFLPAKFDFSLGILESEELRLSLSYRKDVFTPSFIERCINYLSSIIDHIIQDVTETLDNIEIITAEEKSQMLYEFNDTSVDYNLEQTILDRFMVQSKNTPDAIAIELNKEQLTYKDLHTLSDVWAKHLIDLGIGEGDIIGLLMTRSVSMITSMLAIMKTGAAYVAINPNQPLLRTLQTLEDCDSKFVLTNMVDVSEEITKRFQCLHPNTFNSNNKADKSRELPGVSSKSLAYIIYTSGSTGQPKGVKINHEGVTNFILHQKEYFGICANDRILQFSPYYFDASIEQIWLALTTGARLVLINEETILDAKNFKAYLLEKGITHLHSTPSFLERIELNDLPDLKRVISAGEVCKPYLAKEVSSKYDFYNKYGPTETTVSSIIYKVTAEDDFESKIPIGRPIANTKLYILNDKLALVPKGAIGELYIGGRGVSSGYLNRPNLTKERFVDNPFGEGVLYKTGDLVKWLPNGTVDYVGRNDFQVKIRGYRIELGEIESKLETIDSVAKAVVTTYGGEHDKQLVAYLSGEKEKDNQLQKMLSSQLPNYMIPNQYIWVDSFALTANGKIDMKALPTPEFNGGVEYIAPENEDHQKLVNIWSEVLNIAPDEISITSDFFSIGGHSLLAITLINKISQLFNVEVSLRDLFSNRNIIELAKCISDKEKVSFNSIPVAEIAEYYPLSSAQQRMYFLYQLDKNGTSYNMPGFYKVDRELNLTNFEKAFTQIVERHQSLRTVFKIEKGAPVQEIKETNSFNIVYHQCNSAEVDSFMQEFVRPFDLSNEIPIRVSLLDVKGEDYVLLIDIHHISNDGVSKEILMRDFWNLYHEEVLPELPIQYKDYAVWQQSDIHGELVTEHKEYWLNTFNEIPSKLELPKGKTADLEISNAETQSLRLTSHQSSKLRELASTEGVTMYTLFLAIYNVFLSKLSNQKDIVVGTPIAGRNHTDLAGIVGMFVNTLALRNQVNSQVTFKEFLSEVHYTTVEAFDHQSYQYDDLIEALGLNRNISSNPLFDVFFSYNQEYKEIDFSNSDLKMEACQASSNPSKFELELDVFEEGKVFSLVFNYDFSLFNTGTIGRFFNYIEETINQVISNQNVKLSEIDILGEQEKNQILYEFNTTISKNDDDYNLVNAFEKQVLLTPNANAIYFEEIEIKYQELNEKVNKLSNYLIDVIKVGKGDQVGIYLGRSPEMIIAFLAVLKSGATYVALDPENPLERLNTLIDDSGMKFILTNQVNDLLSAKTEIKIINLKVEAEDVNNMSNENPNTSIQNDNEAYIIYTSGSTGKPKGVVIQHDSLLDYSVTFKNYFSLTPEDKVIQQASPAFDTVVEEVFPAFLSGASIVILREGGKNITSLIENIQQKKATVLSTVPAVLQAINDFAGDLDDLRVIVSGGDVLLPRYIDKLIKVSDVYNTYGPSESTVCITYHKVDVLENASCIGKPISNRQVFILNEDNQLNPIGVPGELCVSGKGLAKEYLNDIDLTAKKFIQNPIIPGEKMYRTGDAAMWNEDGSIEFLGRIDNQVKIRGVRIEPGEIEAKLELIDSVNQALVTTYGTEDNKQLVAYLCGNDQLSNREIRSNLVSKLPEYMIPVCFVWIDSIPLNSNGKIDKKALPIPDFELYQEYIAPENDDQNKLVEIWSEVLGIDADKISIIADFFNLGGHSLTAITLLNKINKVFNVEIPLKDLFINRTIAELSNHILQLDHIGFESIPKIEERDYYPLSSAQRRMYFLYEFDKNSTTYNMPGFFRIGENLDVLKLETAFKNLVIRHQSLRSVFEIVDGVPMQRIIEAKGFEIEHYKGSNQDIEMYRKSFVRPFDLSEDFPIRVALMNVENNEYVLFIDLHHIINDGVSHEILMHEFWALYHGEELSDIRIQYVDYAVWQQSKEHKSVVDNHRKYWLEKYNEEVKTLELPTDYPRPLRLDNSGDIHSLQLTKFQSDKLRSLANSSGVTMYTLFLAMYNILLSKLSNQSDIVVGTPTAGRHHADLEGLVGMFVNTLPLRNQVDSELTFTDFLTEVQEQTVQAFDHQLYQYEELVDDLKLSRDSGHNPLFDVLFNYNLGFDDATFGDYDVKITNLDVPYTIAKFDLSLNVLDSDQISLSFTYRTDLFNRESISRFSGYLNRIVDEVVRDAEQIIAEIDVLSKSEKRKLLEEFNSTLINYDLDRTVLDRFKAQALQVPEKEALTYNDERISYHELHKQSDAWATHLIDKGVMPGTIVGLYMDRSCEMITAILAVMKAGAAYVPINPEQPISRTEHMLEDCEVKVIIGNVSIDLPNLEWYTWLTSNELDKPIETLKELPYPSASDLAYVIYTSGSTGQPKGVMIHHESLSNLNCFQKDYFEIVPDDRLLQFSPYYFDASVEQIWLALTSGTTLVLISKETILDNDKFTEYLFNNKITYIHSTPSFLENLLIDKLPLLRLIISAGEACKPSLANKLVGKSRLINEYGPTECTVISTTYDITETVTTGKSVPIGKPIANVKAYILDDHLKLLPQGVIGELYLGGKGLSSGYLKRADLTADRFIDNPYGSGRLYKTGDLVRWLADGTIEYLGRNDHQVQLRGYRIELGEIEAQLEAIELVDKALVLPYGSEHNTQLVAYLSGEELD
ncbi:amino acid adenylation domain-containing protein, partial [Aquimarina sp. D1M17]|uniref:non-ribosomal peptide synthetase n=1 Tax=Aquimarina acroporae TaxID=2937283 RepID=UPI0020BFEBFF